MLSHILETQPLWLQIWVLWMVIVNTVSLFFVLKVEARWVLAAWVLNGLTMSYLFNTFGFTRILGLSHVIWWTPLLVYLYRRRENFMKPTVYGIWLQTLFLTNGCSLLIDYLDVIRYLFGDRAPL